MNHVVAAESLAASYAQKSVLTEVTFRVEQPGIYGLIGANGVGKTTLMRIIAGQKRPASQLSSVTLNQQPTFNNPAAMNQMCLMGADVTLPEHLRVAELYSLAAGRWQGWDRARAEELASRMEVPLGQRLRELSRGQKTAAQVVLALAARTPVTMLDEPSLGLDIERRALLYQILSEEKERAPRILMISTHQLDESARVLDHLIVLDHGTLAFQASVEELNTHVLTVTGTAPAVAQFLDAHPVTTLREEQEFGQTKAIVAASPDADVDELWQRNAGVKVQAASLETAVVALLRK